MNRYYNLVFVNELSLNSQSFVIFLVEKQLFFMNNSRYIFWFIQKYYN